MNFQDAYSRTAYLNFFRDTLLPDDFASTDESIPLGFQTDRIKQVTKIGEVPSLDLPVFEIRHKSENDPRVTLSKEAFRLLANYGKQQALILFISTAAANFRLSLVTLELKLEGKRVTKEYSNPRRYSFFLGPQCKTHTPCEYLIKKGRIKNLDDLKERFSIEVVNKEFFTQIALLFTQLTGGTRRIGSRTYDEKGCLKLPDTKDDTIKKEFAVRLIGRLIFCWFLKKKTSSAGIPLVPDEILSTEAIQRAGGVGGYYHAVLEPLFFEVLNTPMDERRKPFRNGFWKQIPFLNGGLFSPHLYDFYKLEDSGCSVHINTLKVPDNWLKKLLAVFETYNFTIDENTPIDVELAIEPEMLGRIFENLLAEINPETGQTARKSTGSYYTPRPIVEYMVDESLKQYLLTKTGIDQAKIAALLSYSDQDGLGFTEKEIQTLVEALHAVKIIDPACGSGAFPMGILQKIFLMLQKLDPDSTIWLGKMLANIPDPMYRNELKKKKIPKYLHKLGIIKDCIFGVDIQPIAVEISKLRCFLSLIVDEKVADDAPNRGIEHLPNLEFKFVCANTLIGLPPRHQQGQKTMFEADDKIDQLKELRDLYLTSCGKEKQKIEQQFRAVQSELFQHSLNWGGRDSQTTILSQWNPFSDEPSPWFDPDWMFGIKEGFDISIGNPPYIQLQKDGGRLANLYAGQNYQTFARTGDIYALFYEKGIDILKTGGCLCYITSNKWMRAGYGEKLRQFFTENKPLLLIDLGPGVFENATVDTNILLIQKTPSAQKRLKALSLQKQNGGVDIEKQVKEQAVLLENLSRSAWFIGSSAQQRLKEKIERIGKPLKEWDVNIYRGIVTGLNEAFIITTERRGQILADCRDQAERRRTEAILKPILRGRDIKRYCCQWAGLWVIAIPAGWTNENRGNKNPEKFIFEYFPSLINHLLPFKSKAKERDDQGDYWWELRHCAYYSEFEKEKIIYPNMTKFLPFIYDKEKYYTNQKCFILVSQNASMRYLTAFLNSKIAHKWIRDNCPELQGGTRELSYIFFQNLPVPPITSDTKPIAQQMERMVDKILAAKKQNPQADTTELEHQIDQLVYQLYGLTDAEIALVENSMK